MFNINGVDWGIKLVSPNHPKIQRTNGTYALGACDDNTKLIYISDLVSNQKLKKVLCHEITHAAMFSYKINLTIDQEELIADLIATYGEEIINITNKIFNKIKG